MSLRPQPDWEPCELNRKAVNSPATLAVRRLLQAYHHARQVWERSWVGVIVAVVGGGLSSNYTWLSADAFLFGAAQDFHLIQISTSAVPCLCCALQVGGEDAARLLDEAIRAVENLPELDGMDLNRLGQQESEEQTARQI
jgi:hypothetical protein